MSLFDRASIGKEVWDELEELLISADVGVSTTEKLINIVKQRAAEAKLDGSHVRSIIKDEMIKILNVPSREASVNITPPKVYLVVGVNGSGKTTSIAKLAWALQRDGKKVLLAAADTFRAAAIDQLGIWSQRLGVELVHHQPGADPAAVAFDACDAAIARKADVLIVDTAGRLQTKVNLMKELEKIRNVVARKVPGAPHETLLVLDATVGQNAISQAKHFHEATAVTGLFLAKLDGTAKGGIVVAIHDQLKIPVKFVGVGEKLDDIEPFDPGRFVEALFESEG